MDGREKRGRGRGVGGRERGRGQGSEGEGERAEGTCEGGLRAEGLDDWLDLSGRWRGQGRGDDAMCS